MPLNQVRELNIQDECAPLRRIIIGLGAPYQRDKQRVAAEMPEFPLVPDTDRRAEVLALTVLPLGLPPLRVIVNLLLPTVAPPPVLPITGRNEATGAAQALP